MSGAFDQQSAQDYNIHACLVNVNLLISNVYLCTLKHREASYMTAVAFILNILVDSITHDINVNYILF